MRKWKIRPKRRKRTGMARITRACGVSLLLTTGAFAVAYQWDRGGDEHTYSDCDNWTEPLGVCYYPQEADEDLRLAQGVGNPIKIFLDVTETVDDVTIQGDVTIEIPDCTAPCGGGCDLCDGADHTLTAATIFVTSGSKLTVAARAINSTIMVTTDPTPPTTCP